MRSSFGTVTLGVALAACRPTTPPSSETPAAEGTPTPTPAPTAAAPDDEGDGSEAPPSPAAQPSSIRVAITVDDLPGDHHAVAKMLDVFEAHHTAPVFGFVNAKGLQGRPEKEAVLRRWLDAGHRLGSHTFSHPHLRQVGVEAFVADIQANEAPLRELTGHDDAWKVFRYPFLEQGGDAAQTEAVRAHLQAEGYRIAEVTIDFGDWAWNPAYSRCTKKNDEKSITALHDAFLGTAWMFLGWAEAAGREVYGRPIPHVLLLHSGGFDGVMLDELLTLYEKQGVEWIPLEEAMDDPAYLEHAPPPKTHGDTMLEQRIETTGATHPPWVIQPLALLDAVCR